MKINLYGSRNYKEIQKMVREINFHHIHDGYRGLDYVEKQGHLMFKVNHNRRFATLDKSHYPHFTMDDYYLMRKRGITFNTLDTALIMEEVDRVVVLL